MTDYTMPLAGLVTTIVIIILGIVDLIFVLRRGTGTSVSNFLINVGFKSPVFVFAIGFVAGHLFGYMTPAEKPKKEVMVIHESPLHKDNIILELK